jgi:hypothetical protein
MPTYFSKNLISDLFIVWPRSLCAVLPEQLQAQTEGKLYFFPSCIAKFLLLIRSGE